MAFESVGDRRIEDEMMGALSLEEAQRLYHAARASARQCGDTRLAAMTAQNLGIMDATAFALCRDQKLPIRVFSIFKPGALKRVVQGEDEGTLVRV